ncbi:transposase [Allorhizocola rhizosphaerae]|uniref:transposase n=1 Tax=Allorhizocola rhizosphaerae TaxID=1872709 RepID=UPI003CCC64BF
MVHPEILGDRRIRTPWIGLVQRHGISPELRRVLRRPQRELLSYGSSRSNCQGVHDLGQTPLGAESTMAQASRRANVHQARYCGETKTHLQHVLTAAAINIIRLDAWITGTSTATT